MPVLRDGVGFGPPMPGNGSAQNEDPAPELQHTVAHRAFDLEVFGSTGDAATARDFMNGLLANKISRSEGMHRCSPLEKKKLELAGHGDIKRLLDRIEEERKVFDRAWEDPGRSRESLLRLRTLRLEIRRGPFGAESLFAKTLKKMGDTEGLARGKPGHSSYAPSR